MEKVSFENFVCFLKDCFVLKIVVMNDGGDKKVSIPCAPIYVLFLFNCIQLELI